MPGHFLSLGAMQDVDVGEMRLYASYARNRYLPWLASVPVITLGVIFKLCLLLYLLLLDLISVVAVSEGLSLFNVCRKRERCQLESLKGERGIGYLLPILTVKDKAIRVFGRSTTLRFLYASRMAGRVQRFLGGSNLVWPRRLRPLFNSLLSR